ncbi:Cleavage and polyadenylation specificity factor subunit [Echinococcus granulosus]|uniref:Cleavage and polyadenylation specificity factor subunit n=1 Tax=Echinococcus granulosus TaxID=6210 RepID=W6V026_ECHGR|nr:Cleavage and polyadenylation specificity factor subunit [Echinococcus granulosus]EUB64172.1 Cleavage and polyadenylation specificity factor subunit [Echinococcus granulosus]
MEVLSVGDCEVDFDDNDKLSIMPLGAGQEVGRSCILLTFKGKKIILDCGVHPGLHNKESLPFIDAIPEIETTDLILISHYHLDHCGALPFLLLKTNVRAKCYMTHATRAIYRYLLADFVKVRYDALFFSGLFSNSGILEQSLYTDGDIVQSLEKIDPIDFHQELEVNGIKFSAYHAGHVLGAAMFLIEIAGVKILYTGDFSRQEDRHLMCAEVPPHHPDILITESTYGIHIHDKREEREKRFTSLVHDIISRGGRCLIPAFALGRAQELMLILDEYWAAHPELQDVPIYYASQLACKCMAVYQTFIAAMNDRIRNQVANNNPFCFRFISNLQSRNHLDDSGPCVVLASPGMMQSGLSRELFENWCTDKRNGVIIAGYCVEGTPAKQILSQPAEVPTMSGQMLPLKCSVEYISFSAHTDYQQTSEFIRELKPNYVVLVHGEQNEMMRLAGALQREYEDDENCHLEIFTPKNCESVNLRFKGEKVAKVLGSLAKTRGSGSFEGMKAGDSGRESLSGVLVKKNFAYHIITPTELPVYTELATTVVTQVIAIPFSGSASLLQFHLTMIAGKVKVIEHSEESVTFIVFDEVTVTWQSNVVRIKWVANPVNDMYADAIQSAVLRASPISSGTLSTLREPDFNQFCGALGVMLQDAFGPDCLKASGGVVDPKADRLRVDVDENVVEIDLKGLTVKCLKNSKLERLVVAMIRRLNHSLSPV